MALIVLSLLVPGMAFAQSQEIYYENNGISEESLFINNLLKDINQSRAENGLKELVLNEKLMEAAQKKADHMSSEQYFAHYSPKGNVSPWHWFYEANYSPKRAGENLALSPKENSSLIVNAWLNSPSHKKNIMNTYYEETGLAVVKGMYKNREVYYIVQMFGLEK